MSAGSAASKSNTRTITPAFSRSTISSPRRKISTSGLLTRKDFGSLTAWLFPDLNTRAMAMICLPRYIYTSVYTFARSEGKGNSVLKHSSSLCNYVRTSSRIAVTRDRGMLRIALIQSWTTGLRGFFWRLAAPHELRGNRPSMHKLRDGGAMTRALGILCTPHLRAAVGLYGVTAYGPSCRCGSGSHLGKHSGSRCREHPQSATQTPRNWV